MRGTVLALFILSCCGPGAAQKVRFSPAEKSQVLGRVESVPQSNQERAELLRQWFADAGCNGKSLEEQPVSGSEAPNVICRLKGDDAGIIVVGAHYDGASSAQRPMDNWSGVALLPSLYQCLRAHKRRHTIIFVAFADRGNELTGAETFARQLRPAETRRLHAMVNIDALGLSPTKVWMAHSDKDLVHSLVIMMYAMKLPASQINIAGAGNSDSEPFAALKVPQITIHSLTQVNLAEGTASKFRPGAYYDSYRLLCGYLAYLDKTVKPRRRAE